jgi:hypothetical protein
MKIKISHFFLGIIGMLVTLPAQSQDCGCDFTLKPTTTVISEFFGSNYSYQPGDTFCLKAGTWNSIRFNDFHGTANAPLVFINCGGEVLINPGQYSGISFKTSSFIRLTGTGDELLTYGIVVDGDSASSASAVEFSNFTTDAEMDHCEILNISQGGSGIKAKTDPDCNDTTTWRKSGFVLKNLHIHHNHINGAGDEGMYIGYTGGYYTSKLICDSMEVFGHTLANVHIHHNIVENTGRDGIQVSLCDTGLDVHDNYVHTYGRNKEYDQNFGFIMGAGNKGKLYRNISINTDLYNQDINSRGIAILNCIPPTTVSSNVIVNCGGPGIWLHNRIKMTDLTKGYYVINNTIIRSGMGGILYNTCIPPASTDCQTGLDNGFYNNLIVDPGVNYVNSGFWKGKNEEYIDFNTRELRDSAKISNNYTTDTMSAPHFRDTSAFDYHIDSLSPARNVGMDVSAWGVLYDLDYIPYGYEDSTYDAGAFEWVSKPPPPPWDVIEDVKNDVSNTLLVYPNPTDGTLNVRVWLDNKKDIKLKLIDMNGAEIYSKRITEVAIGENTFRIDVSGEYKGSAILVAFINAEVRTKMVVIQ